MLVATTYIRHENTGRWHERPPSVPVALMSLFILKKLMAVDGTLTYTTTGILLFRRERAYCLPAPEGHRRPLRGHGDGDRRQRPV